MANFVSTWLGQRLSRKFCVCHYLWVCLQGSFQRRLALESLADRADDLPSESGRHPIWWEPGQTTEAEEGGICSLWNSIGILSQALWHQHSWFSGLQTQIKIYTTDLSHSQTEFIPLTFTVLHLQHSRLGGFLPFSIMSANSYNKLL